MEPSANYLPPFHLRKQHDLKRTKVTDNEEDYSNNKEDTNCEKSKLVQELSAKNAELEDQLFRIKLDKSSLEDKLLSSSCYFNKQLKEAYSQRNHYQVLCQKLNVNEGEVDDTYDDEDIGNDNNKLVNGYKTIKAKYIV